VSLATCGDVLLLVLAGVCLAFIIATGGPLDPMGVLP